jgi:TetR/AcrR family tetracycline transcriptional repressor
MVGDHVRELDEPRPGQHWSEWLAERSRAMRAAMLSHRDSALLAAQTRPTTDLVPGIEKMLRALREAGFAPGDALRVILVISNYVTGSVLEEQGTRDRTPEQDAEVQREVEVADFPNVRAAMSEFAGPGDVFEYGLQLLIDGFRARARAPHG